MSKPAFTYRQQLDLLKSRGLIVPDDSSALQILEHHNYYRLSAYRFSFTVPGNPDQFIPGTTFNQIWDLYQFDRSLRQLVMDPLCQDSSPGCAVVIPNQVCCCCG
jgi:abortive infection bacteriophage resistance protein